MRTIVVGLLLGIVAPALADEPKPPELTAEEKKLAADASKLHADGRLLFLQKKLSEAAEKLGQALEIRRKLYPAARYPDGHASLSENLNDLGIVRQQMGAFDRAVSLFEESVAMTRRLYPPTKYPKGNLNLAQMLNNLGFALRLSGANERALQVFEETLAEARRLYPEADVPNGHPLVAQSLVNFASQLETMGAYERAMPLYEQGWGMLQRFYPASKYPDGHGHLFACLNNLGTLAIHMGEYERAVRYVEQSLTMARKLYPASKYPDGHPNLTIAVSNLGALLRETGVYDKALPLFEEAHAATRKRYPPEKYPDGHADLILSLNNLATVLGNMGANDRALTIYRQAAEMCDRSYPASKYPRGHPDHASTLNNLGLLLTQIGSFDQARGNFERALDMRRNLYPLDKFPNGHPYLALSLNNLASLLEWTGEFEPAERMYAQVLAMFERLYPPARYPAGHPNITKTLGNLAFLAYRTGHYDAARSYFLRAMAAQRQQTDRLIWTAPESDAIAHVSSLPSNRDAYLSLDAVRPGPVASAYRAVWDTKSAVTRVQEARHAVARAAGTEQAGRLDRLRAVRRRTDQVLQDDRLAAARRDELLAPLAAERDRLERELADAMPELKRRKDRDAQGPEDLQKELPTGTAFIDLVAYIRVEFDPQKKGAAADRFTPSYAAFVSAPGRPVRRVELGPAAAIDTAVRTWRQVIENRQNDAAAAESVSALVWAPVAAQIPAGTTGLFLSPDGDLARLPWAALPVGKGRVLLEDFSLTTVPHGPFLLENLKPPSGAAGLKSVLAVGDVTYGDANWPALPGTRAEVDALARISPAAALVLSKGEATAARLAEQLPKASYAHFATHGEFKADQLAAAKRRRVELPRWQNRPDRDVAVKNPLGYVGLVLANGEVMTGLSLIDLSLENLKVVTLSACETGLGAYTGGEGVQGLQRAFHLAGCPNVIASLWKVNDAATAALMAKFYHEMWVNKKEPLAALREAQLTVYYHPELIPDLAGERGAPKLKEAVAVKSSEPPASAGGGRKRADTKLWAAFVLSGVGK